MDIRLDPAKEQFRDHVRSWVAEHLPAVQARHRLGPGHSYDDWVGYLRDWHRALAGAGLIGLSWPEAYGGQGASPVDLMLFYDEMAAAGAPPFINEIGLEVVGPSIVKYGTDAQKRRLLPRILDCSEIWCQGFSEPNAGSDLTSLRTAAVLEGDEWVINGQKVWTSYAPYARWCALLARTDPQAAPHRGISYLIVDMTLPGISVRPLVQMTGDAEFAEVFFENVRIPRSSLLGQPNQGWEITLDTLRNERGPWALYQHGLYRAALQKLIQAAARTPRGQGSALDDPAIRRRLAQVYTDVRALRTTLLRRVTAVSRGVELGSETSVEKLQMTRCYQRLYELALDILQPGIFMDPASPEAADFFRWQRGYLFSRSASIYGGTSQIQLNTIARRVLGLPR